VRGLLLRPIAWLAEVVLVVLEGGSGPTRR